jgi:transcriptional regulator with AAA-type ATPase domain
LSEKSNFKTAYQDKLKVVELPITDLRDEKQIANEVSKWTDDYFAKQKQDSQYIINVSLGSNETQVVWHILAEAGRLPENTRFIKIHDDKTKSETGKRFKLFSIKEIPVRLFSEIEDSFSNLYIETNSPKRKLVNKKMEAFLNSGFSILLIGERGIGKSQIAGEAKQRLKEQDKTFQGEIIEANCASFDDDSKAESELFGYKKGSFTGANSDKKGLIEAAEKGVLFLDEIHHLSKFVQAKLMKALQTDEYNRLSIRRMGNEKERKIENVRLIFATNKTVSELRECLLPDFYDRIVQHVVNIPSLRETAEDRVQDWENSWKQLKFKTHPDIPKEQKLIKWIKSLSLYGNYRDLQKIAIYYNAFQTFSEETKEMIKEKTPFQYAKNEFEKYHSHIEPDKKNVGFEISHEKSADEMTKDFHFQLYEWAIKKWSRKEAAKKLNVTEKTLNNWKNRK